jgi:hypothetical protein
MPSLLPPWPIPAERQLTEVSRTLDLLDGRYEATHESRTPGAVHRVTLAAREVGPGETEPEMFEVEGWLADLLAGLRLFCHLRGVEIPDA